RDSSRVFLSFTSFFLFSMSSVVTITVLSFFLPVPSFDVSMVAIDEDDIEEMDIKWNMDLLRMRADRFWKKTGKKISIQGSDVTGFDKLKSYMANDEENHALVADKEAPIEFTLMANISVESKVFDNSLCSKDCKKNTDSLNSKITDLTDKLFDAKNMIYHYKLGLAQVESRLVEHKDQEIKYCEKIRGLKYKTESSDEYIAILKKELDLIKKEKEGLDNKLTGFQTASKDLDSLLESQRLDKNKEGLGYSVVPPPPAQIYSSPKKDLSCTGLPEFKNDTVTDYSRPSPTIENKAETAKKPPVKYAEQYRKPKKKPNVRGNQRNLNNLKSYQLGPNFVMKKNACFNCGDFNHLAYNCRKKGSSQNNFDDKGYWENGCSRHMTGNISYLSDYEPFDEGYVSFGKGGCKITGKGTIKTDDDNVLLRTPRQHNMYSIDLNNVVPHKDLTCLVAKASADKCMLWHRRLGHLNFKTMNKLVRHNLVRGLPTKCFENDHTCTACLKGKQHKASCKSKLVNFVSKPLYTLHMDLFGPTSVSSISHKWGNLSTRQWEHFFTSSGKIALAVGTSFGSGNFLLAVGTSSGSGITSLEVGKLH
nr:hypothetical protein [Tanacetum cinerariifolium]